MQFKRSKKNKESYLFGMPDVDKLNMDQDLHNNLLKKDFRFEHH